MTDSGEAPSLLCGVLEGFYNRPWSQDQRLDLFKKMKRFGLNCYVYAPKDDHKHRTMWREPYDSHELNALKELVDGCKANSVHFLFGISPGLDMTYSSSKDLDDLKMKVDQLKSVGCVDFALLWDDIDNKLPSKDEGHFRNIGEAHVKISNAIFDHLKPDLFIVCPVEYCANRAEPCVKTSPYLNALGEGLRKPIGIFWTGSKVVSRLITAEEMIKLKKVLRRKPIIWDNLHANDYDIQRLFLGPYAGRSPDIIPHIRGIMTNPNCQYSFNIPVLFSLSAWSHCYDAKTGTVLPWDPVSAAELSVPHFLEEMRRPTHISVYSKTQNIRKYVKDNTHEQQIELVKEDVEFLIHLFWLPHSHGPKGEHLVKEFKYLRDHAHLVKEFEPDEEDDDESDCYSEQCLVNDWLERASNFSKLCNRFSRICDKISYIENRQLFFDLNPYLNNLQVMLMGCSRYLKWVGLDQCNKPITGGPTLAGLPGGLTGDLHRLYPIRDSSDFPLVSPVSQSDPSALSIRPVLKRRHLADSFIPLFCQSQDLDEADFAKPDFSEYVRRIKLNVFWDQPLSRCYSLERDDLPMAVCVCARTTDTLTDDIQAVFEDPKFRRQAFPSGVALTHLQEKFPWDTLRSSTDSVLTLTAAPEMIFTRSATRLVRICLEELEAQGCTKTLTFVERNCPVTKQFLVTKLGFRQVHKNQRFTFLVCDLKELDEKMEEQ